MRVAFITHTPYLYGANHSLLALMRYASRQGHDPYVLVPQEGDVSAELEKRSIPYAVFPFKAWLSAQSWKAPFRLVQNAALVPTALRTLRMWDVDAIHTNSSVTPFGAMLAAVGGYPHIWHVREFGQDDYGLSHDWGQAVFEYGMERADHLIAVSHAVRDRVLAGLKVPISVVYNGVVTETELQALCRVSRSESDLPSDVSDEPFVFLIIGLLAKTKGQRQAIRAFVRVHEQNANCRLWIAGDGEPAFVDRLKEEAHTSPAADAIKFLGYVDDPFDVYRSCSAVLVCSVAEAMGRVTAEAMAAAKPVIGRDSGGTSELIDSGTTGLLYDGTTRALSNAMLDLIRSPRRTQKMGREGQKKAATHFTIETYGRRVVSIIDRYVRRTERTLN